MVSAHEINVRFTSMYIMCIACQLQNAVCSLFLYCVYKMLSDHSVVCEKMLSAHSVLCA